MTTAAKPKTRKHNWGGILAASIAVVFSGAAIAGHILTAALIAAAALTGLVFWARA
jgi:hypothetical protein